MINELFDDRAAEHVVGLLREAQRSAPPPGLDFLVERVLEGATDSFFDVDSPIGPVYVAIGPEGVRELDPADSAEEFAPEYRERFGRLLVDAAEDEIEDLKNRMWAALAGKRIEVPLNLSQTSSFQRHVLETVRDIPRGEVRPYVWVARG
jgi:O6-methylguanine-DNA--protein-cysteine methyltransferase